VLSDTAALDVRHQEARRVRAHVDHRHSHGGAAYADSHSLDPQRAYSIICDIAGSNEDRYDEINQAGILPKGDIQSCPAQYEQDVKSFTQVLSRTSSAELNFQAPSN